MPHSQRKRLAAASRSLRMEALEDRRVLATFMVTELADDGPGSLRRAVLQANIQPGPDTIQFAPALSGHTISLTTGEIAIRDAVTIDGSDLTERISLDVSENDVTPDVDDGQGSRVFLIDDQTSDNIHVSLVSLALHGGDAAGNGGLIFSQEQLTIDDVHFSDSHTVESGGAIYGNGQMTVTRSRFEGLSAGRNGGAMLTAARFTLSDSYFAGNEAAHDGGALATQHSGTSQIVGNEFVNNLADNGGALHVSGNGIYEYERNQIEHNQAATNGGGMFLGRGNQHRIEQTTLLDNSAGEGGGGIYVDGVTTIRDSVVSRNEAGLDGGGVYAFSSIEIAGSSLAENTATRFGGGVYGRGRFTADQVVVRGNLADQGGGLYDTCNRGGASTITSSQIESNAARVGGGVWAAYANCTANWANSTVALNVATERGGGMYLAEGSFGSSFLLRQFTVSGNRSGGDGGGVYAEGVMLGVNVEFVQSTVVENRANFGGIGVGSGGGIWAAAAGLRLFGTILAANDSETADGSVPDDLTEDGNFRGVTIEYSLLQAGPDLGGNTNLYFVDPLLGPLQDNGGPMSTHAPSELSPAIDAGNPLLEGYEFDQRGEPFTRIKDGNADGMAVVDMGAIEFQVDAPPVSDAGDDVQARVGEAVVLDGSASFDFEGQPLTFTWTVIDGPDDALLSHPNSAMTGFTAETAGIYLVELRVSDGRSESTDTVLATVVTNSPPVADATLSDTLGEVGQAAVLDGSRSMDPDGDNLSYTWEFLEVPIGSTATIMPIVNSPAQRFFVPDVSGTYSIQLLVDDGLVASDPVEWVIEVGGSVGRWHNDIMPADTSGDGIVAPLDALMVINELTIRAFSDAESGRLNTARPADVFFLDVTNDGFIAPLDALLVINAIGTTSSMRVEPTQVARLEPARRWGASQNGPLQSEENARQFANLSVDG